MIEHSLVYLHATKPTRRFVGCGALVEGGYVATCRHVWKMATDAAAKSEPSEPLRVEIEYPRVLKDATPLRYPAYLADACESVAPLPDLVLLQPDEIPVTGTMVLQLAIKEGNEIGEGFAIAGVTGRDSGNPGGVRDLRVSGTIDDHINMRELRQFTGSNSNAYWFTAGSSGSPVFIRNGQQLAGIISLSELGANEGESLLHEAFVVPGTAIRSHVSRLLATPVATRRHLSRTDLQTILDKMQISDVPLAEVPRRLEEFIDGALARAAEPVSRSNLGADIDAAIAASRAKLKTFDTAGAREMLQAKIVEEEATRIRRMVPLLRERAAIELLDFDRDAAKATWAEITSLAPDDVWAWIELGDLWVTTGPASHAADAYRKAEAAALRNGDERDLSVSFNRLGDVQVAQGDLAGALKSYRDSLAIAERLAKSDPGNAGWQCDLSVSFDRVGDVEVAQGDLAGALKSYRDSLAIKDRLATSDPSNAGWQRDLSVSFDRVGDVEVAQGDLAGALKSYGDSLAISDRLATSDPGNARWQHDLSVSFNKVGDVQVVQGDLAGALKSYRDSLGIRDHLTTSDPGNAGWQRDLSVSFDRVGNVQVAQGDLADALTSYRDSLGIGERLATSDPGNAVWQRDLSVSFNKVGDVLMAQGDRGGALKSYRDGIAIRERLATSDPGNAGWQHDLSVSYAKLAGVFRKEGQLPEALQSLQRGRQLMAHLTRLSPDNAVWKGDLAWFEAQIADL
jgi:tetratricopeptide (TPR) repeat protein